MQTTPSSVKRLVENSKELTFSYVIDGIMIDRIQKYSSATFPINLSMLKVYYRRDNPKIGYLF